MPRASGEGSAARDSADGRALALVNEHPHTARTTACAIANTTAALKVINLPNHLEAWRAGGFKAWDFWVLKAYSSGEAQQRQERTDARWLGRGWGYRSSFTKGGGRGTLSRAGARSSCCKRVHLLL